MNQMADAEERERRILEVRDSCDHAYQHQRVSLELARQFAKSPAPAEFLKQRLPRARFERVRNSVDPARPVLREE